MPRWQRAEGKLHAVDAQFRPRPGAAFRGMCGEQLTANWADYPDFADQQREPSRTCWDCHDVWAEMQATQQVVL
jgi:hypothetical protein